MDDIKGDDGGLRELALFSGAGGGILGGKLLGWRTVCAVEIEPYAASVLVQRQNDGILLPFPIWDDVRTFDGNPWRGIVDVVSGGFPCQDISAAGKGAGITGKKSGLWKEMARIISEVRPRYAFVENSPMLTSRGLGTVLGDLAEMGYDARWCVLGAIDAGAPHKRDRIWIVADSIGDIGNKWRSEPKRQQGISRFANGCDVMAYAKSNGIWSGHGENRQKQYRDQLTNSGDVVADADGGVRSGWKNQQVGETERGAFIDGHGEDVSDTYRKRCQKLDASTKPDQPRQFTGPFIEGRRIEWWDAEPELGRVANGVAHRVDRDLRPLAMDRFREWLRLHGKP